jgi:hypothetical protein
MRKSSRKSLVVAAIPKTVTGLRKHFAGQALTLNGRELAVEAVISQLDGVLKQIARAKAAWTAWKQELRTADAAVASAALLLSAVRELARARLGKKSVSVEDFGMKPYRYGKRTLATRLKAAAKSKATRAERHTMGPRQKAKIHGKPK